MILLKSTDKEQSSHIQSFFEQKRMSVLAEKDIVGSVLAILQKEIRFIMLDCSDNVRECTLFLKIIQKIKPSLGILLLSDFEEEDQLRKITACGIICRLMKPLQDEELELAYETMQNMLHKRN